MAWSNCTALSWRGVPGMAEAPSIARSELIIGGQKSGKSRRAEQLAVQWLAAAPGRQAVLIAAATAGDDEMREHQRDRAERVPGLRCVEEPLHLAQAIAAHSAADTLVVVDCLTLWLTNQLMPLTPVEPILESNRADVLIGGSLFAMIIGAIAHAPGPLVLVSNEIGLGVIPLGREVRGFVDALGHLNQQAAAVCERVTLMAAGLPLTLKGRA
jgi:adenosylcobinamide kinase / adenosylcobinamide-phosphate guanylyltransferase